MPKRIKLRSLTREEQAEIQRLASSRKAPMRLVQRARLIKAMTEDPDLPASRAGLQVGFTSVAMGIMWVKRFNAEAIAGLADRPRSGPWCRSPRPAARRKRCTPCGRCPRRTSRGCAGRCQSGCWGRRTTRP